MAYTSPKDMWNVPGKSEADSSGIHVSHISRVPYSPTRRVSPLRDDTLYRPEERTQETQETREPIHPRSWFYYRAPDIFESTAGLPSTADMPEDRQHRRLVPEADSRPPSFFWGEGLFVFPLTLVYTVISYTVLCGARSDVRRALLEISGTECQVSPFSCQSRDFSRDPARLETGSIWQLYLS